MAYRIFVSSARPLAFAAIAAVLALSPVYAGDGVDPYASNNGFAVPADANPPPFDGPYKFRQLSRNYPTSPPARSWLDVKPRGRITLDNANDYMAKLKAYVEPSMRKMVEAPAQWDPAANGWYDMPWMGAAADAEDGRDPILGSFTGQIILASSEQHHDLKADTQNHTVIYYDGMAASTLGDIWRDVKNPALAAAFYREGSLVVKSGGVAATPEQWQETDGAAQWRVYRPPVDQVMWNRTHGPTDQKPWTPVVQNLRVMQFDIIVKDVDAAPETGWVFATFVYDRNAPKGTGPWDQLVPLGVTWGNDPEADGYYTGHPPVDPKNPHGPLLKQFWRNPKAPEYAAATLGWGGRLSGPIDIAERHGVLLVKNVPAGKFKSDSACEAIPHTPITGPFRASGCLSCHGTSQTGISARMYPSPVAAHLPSDGQPFCLYTPGTAEWRPWFQNRNGHTPQVSATPAAITASVVTAAAKSPIALPYVRFGDNPRSVSLTEIQEALAAPPQGLDYDLLLMFAIGTAQQNSSKGFTLLPERQAVH
jgi:hypothetical protein